MMYTLFIKPLLDFWCLFVHSKYVESYQAFIRYKDKHIYEKTVYCTKCNRKIN